MTAIFFIVVGIAIAVVAFLIGCEGRDERMIRYGMAETRDLERDPRPGRRREPEVRWGQHGSEGDERC